MHTNLAKGPYLPFETLSAFGAWIAGQAVAPFSLLESPRDLNSTNYFWGLIWYVLCGQVVYIYWKLRIKYLSSTFLTKSQLVEILLNSENRINVKVQSEGEAASLWQKFTETETLPSWAWGLFLSCTFFRSPVCLFSLFCLFFCEWQECVL